MISGLLVLGSSISGIQRLGNRNGLVLGSHSVSGSGSGFGFSVLGSDLLSGSCPIG